MTHATKFCHCPSCKSARPPLHWLPFTFVPSSITKADDLFPFEEIERRTLNQFSDGIEQKIKDHIKLLTEKLKLRGNDVVTSAKLREAFKRSEALSAKLVESLAMSAFSYAHLIANAGAELGLGQLPDGSYDFEATRGIYSTEVASAAQRSAARMAGSVTRTTNDKIAATIRTGIEENLTMREVASLLQSPEGGGFSRDRAQMIARTESARAFGEGQLEAWKASGVVSKKIWRTSPNACEFCIAVGEMFRDGIDIDTPFFEIGDTVKAGGGSMSLDFDVTAAPPLHPHCRCAIVPVTMEEV